MKILLYNPLFLLLNKEIVKALVNQDDCYVFELQNYAEFKEAFSQCYIGETLVVFSIYEESDVVFLESIQELLIDVKLLIHVMVDHDLFQNRLLRLFPRVYTTLDTQLAVQLFPEAVYNIVQEHLKRTTLR